VKDELTIEIVRRELEKWREVRVGPQRMPEDLVRAAALLAERTSVALVSQELNINHTRLSRAVALLQNERLPLLPSHPIASVSKAVPCGKKLTFTKTLPPTDGDQPSASAGSEVPPEPRIHASLTLPSGLRCDVTSRTAFRILCETLLKGEC
jgi:hypothetical protein